MFTLNINEQVFIAIGVLQLIWLSALSFIIFRNERHYRRLVGKNKKQDLKRALDEILEKIDKQEVVIGQAHQHCQELEKKSLKYMQKIGFLRFNPFSDTGGDQSFVLSFLDGEENGIVLSTLHSRGTTRVYAKAIKKGKGYNLQLSKEEEEAIKRAKIGGFKK